MTKRHQEDAAVIDFGLIWAPRRSSSRSTFHRVGMMSRRHLASPWTPNKHFDRPRQQREKRTGQL